MPKTPRASARSPAHEITAMDDDAVQVKAERGTSLVNGDIAEHGKTSYKSWKKKYRKMRIKFDQKMNEGEELHAKEFKGIAIAKRLAIEIDRLLDLLVEINDSPQIPQDRRIDLSLDPPADPDAYILDIDKPDKPHHRGFPPGHSLKELLRDVPHLDYAGAADKFPVVVADLQPIVDSPLVDPAQAQHPPTFVTIDDVENYLYEADMALYPSELNSGGSPAPVAKTSWPTMAPMAHLNSPAHSNGGGSRDSVGPGHPASNREMALRNPTSVYNWLRKHAPKTFLQDGEGGPADSHKEKEKEKDKEKDKDKDKDTPNGGGGGDDQVPRSRKSTVGSVGSMGGAASRSSKRTSTAASRDKRKSVDEAMEDIDDDLGFDNVPSSMTKGKRKRTVDDDTGYRPKGGSSRPIKKKRKSESGAGVGGETRKLRKSDAAASEAGQREDDSSMVS